LAATDENADQALSVILPAYNESAGIGAVLDQLRNAIPVDKIAYEVIVVDDGSTDSTANVVREHASARPVILLQHHANRGYGAALKTGVRHARYDTLCITDADGTYPNDRLSDLLATMIETHADMVVGARTGENVHIPLIRRPAKWAIGKMANLVAGEPIPDLNSGLRIFRREVALDFFDLLPDGFSFTTTITLAMMTNGYLVEYVPIDYHPRVGKSKIRPVRDTLNFMQLILRIALYFAPLKLFLPLSLLLIILGIAWALFSYFALGRLADVSTLVILMTALQVAVIGLLAELINRRFPGYGRPEPEPAVEIYGDAAQAAQPGSEPDDRT
jgi:glycosyltransferase involved in cell wall biosynthesis